MRIIKRVLVFFLILAVVILGLFKIMHRAETGSNPPVIEDTIKNLHVNCDFTYEDLLQGLTATDDIDGDITDQLMIGEMSEMQDGNTCTYKCGVFDSDGQYSELTRTLTFDDYEFPKIYLSDSLIFYTASNSNKTLRELLSARDKLDGDITHTIQLSGTDPEEAEVGDHFISVTVTNSFNDSVVYSLPIHVLESSSPLYITLSDHLVYCLRNSKFDPMNYVEETSNDTAPADLGYSLSVESNLDTSTPGVYEIEYTLSGDGDTIPAKEYLIVIVQK